jgi:hypothetical protein
MGKPHIPKDPKPTHFAVSTVPPFVRIEEGQPVLSFTFSSLLYEPEHGLSDVLKFSERVLDYDVSEVVLDIRTPLEEILDLTVEGFVLIDAPHDGLDHVSSEFQGEIDAVKASLQKMMDRLNRIQYHNLNPDR